jgi:hypothetical protein
MKEYIEDTDSSVYVQVRERASEHVCVRACVRAHIWGGVRNIWQDRQTTDYYNPPTYKLLTAKKKVMIYGR